MDQAYKVGLPNKDEAQPGYTHKTKIIELNRGLYTLLCEVIPSEVSFSSTDPTLPSPNRILWARCPGLEPTMLVFYPSKVKA